MSWTAFINIVIKYWPMFLRGAALTLEISIIGTIIGAIIGLLIGTIRTIPTPEKGFKKILLKIVNIILSVYIEVFRGTPMIVQAMVIYYGSYSMGIEMSTTFAGIFIVSINTGAYVSEIVRGGIISIDKGQFEAAQAIGMNHAKTMWNIVIPQVIRNILPALGNEFVINIKDTSVLNVISVSELYFSAKTVAGINYKFFEVFTVACMIYLIMTLTVTRILRFIEKRMDGPDSYNIISGGNQMQVAKPDDKLRRTKNIG